ncbi:hypothetical protein [Xanthomonas campestris]|nr:hypothetical protein [Xanthomonas campestris]MEA9671614.1 hypothetical protein [Xanthomonas campestris]
MTRPSRQRLGGTAAPVACSGQRQPPRQQLQDLLQLAVQRT